MGDENKGATAPFFSRHRRGQEARLLDPRKNFIGPQSRGMIVNSGRDHQFVGAGLLNEFFQSGADGLWRADEGASQHVGDVRFFHWRPVRLNVINGRRKLAARAAHGIGKTLLSGSKKPPRFSVSLGSNYVYADHGIRFLKLRRWPKSLRYTWSASMS